MNSTFSLCPQVSDMLLLLFITNFVLIMIISDEWSSPKATGQTPLPCNRFTLATVGKKRAVILGGWSGSTILDDLFVLDLGKHSVVSVPHSIGSVTSFKMSERLHPIVGECSRRQWL